MKERTYEEIQHDNKQFFGATAEDVAIEYAILLLEKYGDGA